MLPCFVDQMKETMDTKEITKISSMNAGSASWFLCSTPSRNFEELHEKVMTYEELQWNAAAAKTWKSRFMH